MTRLAMASILPTGLTKNPFPPCSTISLGPLGQSNETIGKPHALASMRTKGKPSARDDETIKEWF